MNVKQVIEKLSKFPDHMEVFIKGDFGDFTHAPVEEIEIENVRFSEGGEPGDGPVCFDDCIVISAD